MHAAVFVFVCGEGGGGRRQKGAREVLTVEIKEELEKSGAAGTRERERDPLNIQISHFNSFADYQIFHLRRKDRLTLPSSECECA